MVSRSQVKTDENPQKNRLKVASLPYRYLILFRTDVGLCNSDVPTLIRSCAAREVDQASPVADDTRARAAHVVDREVAKALSFSQPPFILYYRQRVSAFYVRLASLELFAYHERDTRADDRSTL